MATPHVSFGDPTLCEPVVMKKQKELHECYLCNQVGRTSKCTDSHCQITLHITCTKKLACGVVQPKETKKKCSFIGYCQKHSMVMNQIFCFF